MEDWLDISKEINGRSVNPSPADLEFYRKHLQPLFASIKNEITAHRGKILIEVSSNQENPVAVCESYETAAAMQDILDKWIQNLPDLQG